VRPFVSAGFWERDIIEINATRSRLESQVLLC